ncbi:TPA: YcaO-like family protein [Klebsiella aerogenes]|nr:YcaO-like family protein [Klebsiella aerogenes]
MSNTIFERSHSISESIEKGLRTASSFGLEAIFISYGESLPMYRCDLIAGKEIKASGKGKGAGLQVIASSLFEALEHYFLIFGAEQFLTCLRLGEHPLDTDIIEHSLIFNQCQSKDVPSFTRIYFSRFYSDEIKMAVPAFLFDPEFFPESLVEYECIRNMGLLKYSTNSGTAAGTTLEDAQLHALMELIERDALSIELLSTIFSANPRPVLKININTLTDDLKKLVYLSELETKGKVTMWFITTDVGVPAVLARVMLPCDHNYGHFGSGASLNIEYAIERALVEAVQGFHIYKHEIQKIRLINTEKLKKHSPFRRCLLEYGLFEYAGGEQDISFDALVKKHPVDLGITVSEQINIAINMLKNAGVIVYHRIILSGDVYISQLYSPSFERFFLVSTGALVMPGKRGRNILKINNKDCECDSRK